MTTAPDWVRHVLWWHVYPLGFTGAEKEALAPEPAVHRLPHLIAWLDYAVELGLSGIALGPVFESETHGYDTTDYYRIDPRLGDDAHFDALITEARARGLRVLLDGVFNHTGRSFAPFREALDPGPEAHSPAGSISPGPKDGLRGPSPATTTSRAITSWWP